MTPVAVEVGPERPPEDRVRDREADERGEQERLVAADAAGELAGADVPRDDPERQRDERDARPRRVGVQHDLHEQRQEDDRDEERHADQEHGDHAVAEDRLPEQLEVDDRLGGAPLDHVERGRAGRGEREQAEHERVGPARRIDVAGRAARRRPERERDEQRHDRDDQRERAGDIERALLAAAERGHLRDDERDRERADRQVDEEDPVPAHVIGDHAAGERADHAGHTPHRADQAGVLGAAIGREQIGDDRERGDEQRARAEPLHGARGEQHLEAGRRAARRRAGEEDHHADQEHRLAAVDVGQLARDRDHHRRRDHVRRHDPAVQRVGQREVDLDRARGGRDDRLIERAEEHAEHDPGQRQRPLRRRELLGHGRR